MSKLFEEMALSDSSVYRLYNTSAELSQTLVKAIKNSTVIDKSYIEEQILQIEKSKPTPITSSVMDAFYNGDIVLLYSKILKIPQAIPFFAVKTPNGVKVFIFVNNYAKVIKSKTELNKNYLNIQMKDLYSLLEGAYIAYKYATNGTMITRNYALMKLCMEAYSLMFMRLFAKEYALSMDLESYDKVLFCLNKFFIEKVWGLTNIEMASSYASNYLRNINVSTIGLLNEEYNNANIDNIEKLLEFLRTVSPRMRTVSLRYTSQQYMNAYKPTALFAMEVLPYFMFVIQATMIGSFLVNSPMIGDVVKNIKGINKFYPELVKIS